jgi:hypothetical protein
MADITMCSNKRCLLADFCYRVTALQSKRQPFSYFTPNSDDSKCIYMIPNEKYKVFNILQSYSTNYQNNA